MKYNLLFAFLLIGVVFFVKIGTAAEPMWQTRAQDGEYAFTHPTISISSSAVTSISAKQGYQKVYLQFEPSLAQMQAGTSVYIRLDGSTSNMSNGYIVKFTTDTTTTQAKVYNETFETNSSIKLQLPAGTSGTLNARYTSKEK
jgi:hypothetical protein